eukprot:m.14793 g.14793  ORF g.14793 m.14793 type:complete len:151 (-) comp10348_c0_seq4:173-625(-)
MAHEAIVKQMLFDKTDLGPSNALARAQAFLPLLKASNDQLDDEQTADPDILEQPNGPTDAASASTSAPEGLDGDAAEETAVDMNIVCGLLEAKSSSTQSADAAEDDAVDKTFQHEALTDAVMAAILQDATAIESLGAKPALVTELAGTFE